MDIYKIVKGNSFSLFIQMQKAYISQNKQMLEYLDVAAISNLEVILTDYFGECIAVMSSKICEVSNGSYPHSEIMVTFPSDLDEGVYGITIKGKYRDNDLCSIEKGLFRIVERNGKSHIPLGVVEGEMGGMYNTKYYIELNNKSEETLLYGALSTFNPANVNLEELTNANANFEGKAITIRTSKERPYIWFVSNSPLVFTQAGFEAELSHTELGDLHYYCTDELIPDDFTYNIKKR